MSLNLTPAARDLIIEALVMFASECKTQANDALEAGNSGAFHVFANRTLEAKYVLKQVMADKP